MSFDLGRFSLSVYIILCLRCNILVLPNKFLRGDGVSCGTGDFRAS